MPLKLRDPGAVPPELWHYPVAGIRDVYAPNWASLYGEIEKVCTSNNIPVPPLQTVIDWCCNNLAIACYDDQTRQPLVNAFALGLPVKLPNRTCCSSAEELKALQ